MHVLLTGVAGFIASKVAELLLAEGHQVVGVDNLNDAYDPRLKQHRLDGLLGRPGFDFVRLDIADRDAIDRLCSSHRPFDAVINLAARAGVRPSVENPWVYVDTNITGTLNLLELCRLEGRATSSCWPPPPASTGAATRCPSPRTRTPAGPSRPTPPPRRAPRPSRYTYHYLHGIDVTVFRYFTVYGPAGRPDMSLFRFCRWIAEGDPVEIFGDGHQSRDFTYVDDIARGTVLGLKPVGYEIINLGSDQPHELLRRVELIEKETGKKAEPRLRPVRQSRRPRHLGQRREGQGPAGLAAGGHPGRGRPPVWWPGTWRTGSWRAG